MEGKDVNILQNELVLLGFNITLDELHNDNPEKALFGESTQIAVKEFQRKNGLQPTGIVDKTTADLINFEFDKQKARSFVVRGQIKDLKGNSIPGIRVEAIDKDLRGGDEQLGEIVTDSQGHYEIQYSSDQFSRAEKRNADLSFKLSDQANGRRPVNFTAKDGTGKSLTQLSIMDDGSPGKSTTIFIKYNAQLKETVNFLLMPDSESMSEYERLKVELEPLLVNVTITGVNELTFADKLADLKKDEIDFLHGEIDIERQKIQFLVAAANLAKKGIEKHIPFALEAFYGLARTKGLLNFEGIARTGVTGLREALIQGGGDGGGGVGQQASRNKIIPPFESQEKLDEVVRAIYQLAVENVRTTSRAKGKPTLAQVLTTALPSDKEQVNLLHMFGNHKGTIHEFWSNLRHHPDFQEPGKVERVQFVLQLAALTQNNLPLMNAMQSRFKSTREMARLDEGELKTFIKNSLPDIPEIFPGNKKDEKLELYAGSVVGILQGAFPTEAVANVISKIADGHMNGLKSSALAKFLQRATDTNVVPAGEEFDIRVTHIDKFMAKHGEKVLADLDETDKDKLIAHVKRAQRLFQVSTSPETFRLLMESKLNSANDIAHMTTHSLREVFGDEINFPELSLIHKRAMAAATASLHLALQVYQSVTDVHPMVVSNKG